MILTFFNVSLQFIKCFNLGNCDTCVEQKILFMNEMKRYKIQPRPKG